MKTSAHETSAPNQSTLEKLSFKRSCSEQKSPEHLSAAHKYRVQTPPSQLSPENSLLLRASSKLSPKFSTDSGSRNRVWRYIYQFNLIVCVALTMACSEDTVETDKKTGKKSKPQTASRNISPHVIYGEDNRLDLYEVEGSLKDLANSTVALMSALDLTLVGDNYAIRTQAFKNMFRKPLCEGERFSEQRTAAFCSGFLVAPNIVVTAGHCIQTEGTPSSDCETTRFVFGFSITTEGELPTTTPRHEVYSCKKILKKKVDSFGADYSVIELDRNVLNHLPLKFRTEGVITPNEELIVMGHPSGLPTKIAGGAQVRDVTATFFRANLDTYGGNSGSAVFNARTLEVEGILVRGETDYELRDNLCMASKVCSDTSCRGEDVTLITEALAGM